MSDPVLKQNKGDPFCRAMRPVGVSHSPVRLVESVAISPPPPAAGASRAPWQRPSQVPLTQLYSVSTLPGGPFPLLRHFYIRFRKNAEQSTQPQGYRTSCIPEDAIPLSLSIPPACP